MNVLNPNWAFNIPTFDEYLKLHSSSIQSMAKDTKYVKKWGPVLEKQFSGYNLNSELMSNICLYIEICSSYYDMLQSPSPYGKYNSSTMRYTDVSQLDTIIKNIKNDINSKLNNKRSAIVRKVFNYQTGKVEYELEDGNFISTNESVIPPKLDVDNDIFPIEFVKLIDPQKYRDMKIDEIL
jgi:hypothetical protein